MSLNYKKKTLVIINNLIYFNANRETANRKKV